MKRCAIATVAGADDKTHFSCVNTKRLTVSANENQINNNNNN